MSLTDCSFSTSSTIIVFTVDDIIYIFFQDSQKEAESPATESQGNVHLAAEIDSSEKELTSI